MIMIVIIENLLVFAIIICAAIYVARKGWHVALMFTDSSGAKDAQASTAAIMGCGAGGKTGCAGCSHAEVFANRDNRMPKVKPLVLLDLADAKQDAPHPLP